MKKKIKTPFLTTSFSQNGKKAKKRLGQILDTRKRRAGIVIAAVILLAALAAWISVAVVNKPPQPVKKEEKSLAGQLYETWHPYVGDAVANGKTLGALGIGQTLGLYEVELYTSDEPYSIRLNFENQLTEDDMALMNDYAAMLMALIGNLGEVTWSCPADDSSAVSRAESIEELKEQGKSVEGIAKLMADLDYEEHRIAALNRRLTETSDTEIYENAVIIKESGNVENLGKLNEFLNKLALGAAAKLYLYYEYDDLSGIIYSEGNGFQCSPSMASEQEAHLSSLPYYKYLRVFCDKNGAYFVLLDDENLTFEEITRYLTLSVVPENPPRFKILFFVKGGESYEEAIY